MKAMEHAQNSIEWEVHKFGGTSLADAERFRHVASLLEKTSQDAPDTPGGEGHPNRQKAVVVSAMSGVTDALLGLLQQARSQENDYATELDALIQRHQKAATALLSGAVLDGFLAVLKRDQLDIAQVLGATRLLRSASQTTQDWLVGFGELWSAQLLCALLQAQGKQAVWLNARNVLCVAHLESGVEVHWQRSGEQLQQWMKEHPSQWLVITGFVASLADGTPTTLKRDGSDFSASIFGALLKAKALTIWTDVDGVFSADPRRVPEAELLRQLSWQEATELAYFGARVLHPHAMAPAMANNIPIAIRNSFHPEQPGTCIAAPRAQEQVKTAVKGFSAIDSMALVNVEGSGMMGVPGVAHRLFGALREAHISVVMISQASSEHSICFAVPFDQGKQACGIVRESFYREIERGQIQDVEMVGPCSILAAVGDAMVDTPGVAAQFFDALGKAGINVRAIAQGSSERNISAVIDQRDTTRALRAVHAGFFLSQQTLSVGLVGPGLIGRALLEQLRKQAEILRQQFHIDLRIRGITNSHQMLLADRPVPLEQWEALFTQSQQPADLEAFANHIKAEHLPHCAIIDCTANASAAQWYPQWLSKRIHILTPNKKAFSSQLSIYREIRQLARVHRVHIFNEATVGAGLPVISTLRDLLQTGDRILQIEGVLSGTLSYLFNTLTPDMQFSQLVAQARAQGYTEPDPRDDLSGMDVARKLVILAREMGMALEIQDIEVESLVPEALRDTDGTNAVSVDAFLQRLPEYDDAMRHRLLEVREAGQVLRYVGVLDPAAHKATVSLRPYSLDHAFARLQGSDNIIAFRTSRYHQQPLLVQGPGAGPEVTAGGVFADLLRLAAHLGAPSSPEMA